VSVAASRRGVVGPSRRLSVLYVGTLPPHPGGSAVSGSQLIAGLARRGHRVRALAPITPEALRAGDAFAARHPAIQVTRFPVPCFDVEQNRPTLYGSYEAEAREIGDRLPDLVARERPDVVFAGRELFAVHLSRFTASLPGVVRVAGGASIGALGGSWPADRARRLFDHLRGMTRVVSPARHLADRLREAGLDNVEVIPNAIDVRRFVPRCPDPELRRRLGIAPGDVVVMHASNLKGLKRPLDIARSARAALAQDPRLRYVIVGDGALRGALEDLCRREGIAGRFRFLGWIEYARMPAVIALADLVVMPCEDEALARVYLETQACGRVLVASDIPAAREVVTHGETGLLFRTGDVAALTAATLRAAADPGLREAIGRRARARVAANHVETALDAWEALLERVSTGRATASRPGAAPARS
jgi:glycosyltransferase involved in cell wall biosynthesis